MSAQIKWLINDAIEKAQEEAGIKVEFATVSWPSGEYCVTVHARGLTGVGNSIEAAAFDLARKLNLVGDAAAKKRREAELLMAEADRLEGVAK